MLDSFVTKKLTKEFFYGRDNQSRHATSELRSTYESIHIQVVQSYIIDILSPNRTISHVVSKHRQSAIPMIFISNDNSLTKSSLKSLKMKRSKVNTVVRETGRFVSTYGYSNVTKYQCRIFNVI